MLLVIFTIIKCWGWTGICPVKIKIRFGRETKGGIAEVTKGRDFWCLIQQKWSISKFIVLNDVSVIFPRHESVILNPVCRSHCIFLLQLSFFHQCKEGGGLFDIQRRVRPREAVLWINEATSVQILWFAKIEGKRKWTYDQIL